MRPILVKRVLWVQIVGLTDKKGCSGRPIQVGGILQRSRVFAPRFLLDAPLHEQKALVMPHKNTLKPIIA